MTITANELEEILDLIAERAPGLREHVSTLKIGDIAIDLRPVEPTGPSPADAARQAALDQAMAQRERATLDPLDDPMTFPGGRVPRFPDRQRPREESSPRDEHEDDDDD